MTHEQLAAIQQGAATLKRRAEATFNACTADPRDEAVVVSECEALIAAWKSNESSFTAVI